MDSAHTLRTVNKHPSQQRRHRARHAGAFRHNDPAAHPRQVQGSASGQVEGVLQHTDERRDGQLRDPEQLLRPANGGVIVPRELIRERNLRPGILLRGQAINGRLQQIETIESIPADEWVPAVTLQDSTALDPQPMMKLEHDAGEFTTRIIDILAPIGFGQRGLIVAPPRTGKTMLLQNIARGIGHNYPDVELILLLVDERPEEVTDMRRNVPGVVYASSNDNTVDMHLDLATLVIERCKRKVEMGQNVIVLMDSLTRLGRAFNSGGPSGGRTMSGGLDNRALEIPKKLFGAARKIENGGSLTILATCLIDTGSRMDQVIFEEFKGTGNQELTLDRTLSNQRIFPSLNIVESGTRKEEKLLSERALAGSRQLRRHLLNMPPAQSMKTLLDVLKKYKTNDELFNSLRIAPT